MTDLPIPFSAPMVWAMLDGRKTQTRRILKPQPEAGFIEAKFRSDGYTLRPAHLFGGPTWKMLDRLPRPGDRLWVREGYYQFGHWELVPDATTKGGKPKWQFVAHDDLVLFEAPAVHRKGRHHKDPATPAWHKRLGRFMPRKYSRLTLIVTGVKIERLQDISDDDAKAEGVIPDCGDGCCWRNPADDKHHSYYGPVTAFRALWEGINGAESWDANPWVIAVTFTVHTCNIDHMETAA